MPRRDSRPPFVPLIDATGVFDDFCRDFAEVPVAWHLDVADAPAARALAAEIGQWITRAGHVRLTARSLDEPRLWFPVAALRIDPSASPTTGTVAPAAGLDVPALCRRLAAAARDGQTATLRSEIAAPAPPRFDVTVVVCTYRRPAALARALQSLATQTLDPNRFEVVVIDNDPASPSGAATVDEARRTYFGDDATRLRLVACPFPGLSFARNAGVGVAGGAIVAFLDDDAEARPDWLGRVRDTFAAHPEAGVVGGRISLAVPEPRPRWAKPGWGRYWSECATGTSTVTVARHWWDYPFGANWSARRTVLLAMGGFRTRFGRTGGDAAGGEEIVAAALAARMGHAVLIDPAAEVLHRPDPARFTLGCVWRRIHAAKREEWAQQRLGYLPATMTTRSALRSIARRLRDATVGRSLHAHERLEHLMHAIAEARLLPALARTSDAAEERTSDA